MAAKPDDRPMTVAELQQAMLTISRELNALMHEENLFVRAQLENLRRDLIDKMIVERDAAIEEIIEGNAAKERKCGALQ